MKRQFKFVSFFCSLLFVYAFLGFCFSALQFGDPLGPYFLNPKTWKISGLLWVLFVGAAWWREQWKNRRKIGGEEDDFRLQSFFAPEAFLLGLCVLLCSDVVYRRFGFYLSSAVSLQVVGFGVLALLFLYFLFRVKNRISLFPEAPTLTSFCRPWFLLLVQGILSVGFLLYADGRLLFSDDHPSFLYRFQLLREHFPNIPFYNTDWNGGYSAREFYPSGILNVFFFVWPFIYFGPDILTLEGASLYTWFIPYIFIFILPWSIYIAARLFQFSKEASILSALLALGPTLSYFEWLLKYGTLGFAFSAAVVPLTIALIYRLSLAEKLPSWGVVFSLLLVSFLCIAWTLSSFALLPVALYALWNFRETFCKERLGKLLIFFLLFVGLNAPWMKTFVEESKVFHFVSGNTLPGSEVKDIYRQHAKPKSWQEQEALKQKAVQSISFQKKAKRVYKRFRETLSKVNPLLLLLFLPGLFVLPNKHTRNIFFFSLVWLFFIATLGDLLKPQLELRRMIIPASFLMTLLASLSAVHLLEQFLLWIVDGRRMEKKQIFGVLGSVALLGSILASPASVLGIYRNQSDEKFVFAPTELSGLSQAIAEHGGSGRTIFLSFILHELGAANYASQDGGHIAPLSVFSGKELYASDFYHSRWNWVDPIPESFRKQGREGIEEFLSLVNVTAVVTFRREWVEYCQSNPRYEQVYKGGRFRLFVRKEVKPSYFLEGAGTVERIHGGLRVHLFSEKAVLKYRFLPKLRVSSPEQVQISSLFAFDEDRGSGKTEPVSFIRLEVKAKLPKDGLSFEIKY